MRITLAELKAFIKDFIAEAKQAGAWTANVDAITLLVEKCAKTFTLDEGDFADKLPELGGEEIQGYWEEFFAGLVPVTGRIDDGSNDELAPNRPVFDEPSYSYPLVDATTGKAGVRFKTTVDEEYFERYINGGNEDVLTNYIIKKLYDSYYEFKYKAKRQLIGNAINKVLDANAGVAYTVGSAVKCGTIYNYNSKFYIANKNKDSGTTVADDLVEITPNLVTTIAKPVDTATAEAFIKQVKADVEALTIDASEGTSISGSTIGAVNTELMLYVKPNIMNVLDVDALAGAFHVDKLAIPAMIKVLPDFGTIDDDNVYGFLVDKRGLKLVDNYTRANATPVNGSLYTNYFLHYGATGVISKHVAMKAYKAA